MEPTDRITLTVPVSLLVRLKREAAAERRSLSNYVALLLAEAMEGNIEKDLADMHRRLSE